MSAGRERDAVHALRARRFDVAIVGGGVHGAWLAWRATRAGLQVALVERDDFAAGTTANSLRILHGGLRYLQHLDLPRMRASVDARREFARLGPAIARPLACVMPLGVRGVRSPWVLGPALLANDVVSWDRNDGVPRRARLPHGAVFGRARTRAALAPLVDSSAFAGALWWDAYAEDPPRAALEPLLAAARDGAAVANRVRAERLLLAHGRAVGIAVTDVASGASFEIEARAVVDATGPGAGRLAAASGLRAHYVPPAWIGGLNLVFARDLGLAQAVALRAASKAADSSAVLKRAERELFFVPAPGATLVGTDYRTYRRADEAPAAAPADLVDAFLDEIARVAPRARLQRDELVQRHWGLLPAASADAVLPSRTAVIAAGAEECGAAGLVVVIGEKLTSAPVVSRRVLERVIAALGRATPRRDRAAGADGPRHRDAGPERRSPPAPSEAAGIAMPAIERRLRARYGERWRAPLEHARERADWLQPIAPGCPALGVEVVHAIRAEWATTVDDVVLRRLGLGTPGPVAPAVRAAVAAHLARELAPVQAATGTGSR